MTLMRWDDVIHWSPKWMEILEVYVTLGQVKVWARTDTFTWECIQSHHSDMHIGLRRASMSEDMGCRTGKGA